MMVFNDSMHSTLLPFASLNNEQLTSILYVDYVDIENFKKLEYTPFLLDKVRYNNELDVTDFYVRKRLMSIPQTMYLYPDELSQLGSNMLTLANMNICSISRNLQYFKDILMHNSSVNFKVIGFTEVWLDAHHSSIYELPGYCLYANSRNIHGGGTTLYVSDRYDSSVQNNLSISESYIETIGAETTITNRNYLFICIYRPPSGNFDSFMNSMNDILSHAIGKQYQGIFIP